MRCNTASLAPEIGNSVSFFANCPRNQLSLHAELCDSARYRPGLSTGMATTQPDETLNTMETDQPYALKMGWFNSSNFLTPTCSAQPKRWHKALQKLEFVVVQDLTMTPTAMAVALALPCSE